MSSLSPRLSTALPTVKRILCVFAFAMVLLGTLAPAWSADEVHGSPAAHDPHASGEAVHHGLPTDAQTVFNLGPLEVHSSMIVTWLVALGIIIFARIATANMKQVPDGAQNFWEWMVESLRNFLEEIIGHRLAVKTFWFFATVFVFILFTNWFGLIPGVGTIGWGTPNEQGGLSHIQTPLFRGVGADLNMTLAMAMIFFVCWTVWAIQSNGVGGFIIHLFGNPARKEMKGALYVVMAIVFVFVGALEVVSILFRPVSLSFRLYGNIFAGENLLESMAAIVPSLAWLIPIPFYFMEVLVGFVQALVFMLLTAVFTLLICSHGDDPDHVQH
ncbi:MAG: F0F1 ATP synthase subunit A [Chthoniobacteraceae bacterium]